MNVHNLFSAEQAIRKLDSVQKFGSFIKLLNDYHVYKCTILDCSQCRSIVDFRIKWRESETCDDPLQHLQQICRYRVGHFDIAQLFLEKIAALEFIKSQIEEELAKTFDLWNNYPSPF